MDEATIRAKLRDFITSDLIRDANYQLNNSEGIITEGLVDSFSLAELGVYIEEEFGVFIPDSDLTVTEMDTLDQIVKRVQQGLN